MNIVFIAKNYCGATCVTETVRNIFRFLNFFKFSFDVPIDLLFSKNSHVSDYSFMLSCTGLSVSLAFFDNGPKVSKIFFLFLQIECKLIFIYLIVVVVLVLLLGTRLLVMGDSCSNNTITYWSNLY
jgi:hypothetical protein